MLTLSSDCGRGGLRFLLMAKEPGDQYSDKEAKARFEAALRGGLKTPPKPLKSMTPKRKKAQLSKKKP
jgi:hypothetical protein